MYLAIFLGVKFNITEVWIPFWHCDSTRNIALASQFILAHIKEQEGDLPELNLETVCGISLEHFMGYFLSLQKASRAWSLEYFVGSSKVPWKTLAKISENGQIGLVAASKDILRIEADQDDVKRVWNITKRFRVLNLEDFGGGLGEVKFPGYFNRHTHQIIFGRTGAFGAGLREDIYRDENGLVHLKSLGEDADSEWRRMSEIVFNF